MAVLTTQTVEYESAQSQQAFAALTNSGDNKIFTTTTRPWSQADGYSAVIAPYGVITGGIITPAAGAGNNNVDVSAMVLMAPGMTGASATTGQITIAAATNIAATRGTSNGYRITSITVDSAGAVTAVAGTESTAFSETRGAAGGPPLIPVGSVEIGQVRFTSITAAAVQASEIYQVVGTHQERYDYPVFNVDYLRGRVTFASGLPLIHTGSVPKSVRVRVATPVFAEIPNCRDWVPAEVSNSTNSEDYYDGQVGSVSSSIGQASFTAALRDGITDGLLGKVGQNLIFRFKPSRNGTAYQLTQGILGVARTFGVKSSSQGSFTVSPAQASIDFDGL